MRRVASVPSQPLLAWTIRLSDNVSPIGPAPENGPEPILSGPKHSRNRVQKRSLGPDLKFQRFGLSRGPNVQAQGRAAHARWFGFLCHPRSTLALSAARFDNGFVIVRSTGAARAPAYQREEARW